MEVAIDTMREEVASLAKELKDLALPPIGEETCFDLEKLRRLHRKIVQLAPSVEGDKVAMVDLAALLRISNQLFNERIVFA